MSKLGSAKLEQFVGKMLGRRSVSPVGVTLEMATTMSEIEIAYAKSPCRMDAMPAIVLLQIITTGRHPAPAMIRASCSIQQTPRLARGWRGKFLCCCSRCRVRRPMPNGFRALTPTPALPIRPTRGPQRDYTLRRSRHESTWLFPWATVRSAPTPVVLIFLRCPEAATLSLVGLGRVFCWSRNSSGRPRSEANAIALLTPAGPDIRSRAKMLG